MNPLRKLKLKSQLRNCDYILAGTVIKQQYYDAKKSTVINRLIDDFIADPGFEHALKLIEYNEMMVFYFTESCAGGLYVRKAAQAEPEKTEELEEPKESENLEEFEKPEEFEEPEESAAAVHPDAEHRKILEESEAWMEQMIASGSRKQTEQATAPKPIEPDEDTLEDSLEDTLEHTLVYRFAEEAAPEAAAGFEPDEAPETKEQESSATVTLPPRAALQKRSYSNVIATLKIDIHTMSRQLDEYRRELSYYPSNEKQLISWIKSLEEAIEEFSDVVDLLEDGFE